MSRVLPAAADAPSDRRAILALLHDAGVRRPPLEYEKAHTYPASQPFFGPLDPSVALAALPGIQGSFWTYVHVPFCNYLCSFCFYRKVLSDSAGSLFPAFLRGVSRELDQVRMLSGRERIEAHDLYLGGGTPTALTAAQLEALLDLLGTALRPAGDYLGTCEASPESVTVEKASLLLERGIRRISLGGQSFDQRRLDAVRRAHSVGAIAQAYERLRSAGCDHVNVDLIYGFPGQTCGEWESELRAALSALLPESFTLYYLRYVPGTPLANQATAADRVPWAELVAMREAYFDLLFDAGYEMCRPHFFRLPLDRVRRYRGAPTLDHGNHGRQIGLGPSAYSHLGSCVSRSAWPISQWLTAVEQNGFGTAEGRILTANDRHTRAAVKSLAGTLGIDRRQFQLATGADLDKVYGGKLDRLAALGLLRPTETGYQLTELGILLDEEVSYFLYPGGFQETPVP